VASQCIPAFSQEDFVLCVVVAAKADPLKASTRLKARIEANAFMMCFLRCRYIGSKPQQVGATWVPECYRMSRGQRIIVAASCPTGWNFVTATPPSSLKANLAVSPRPNPPMGRKDWTTLKGGGLSGSPPFIKPDELRYGVSWVGVASCFRRYRPRRLTLQWSNGDLWGTMKNRAPKEADALSAVSQVPKS
jgi:hypothetical protein